MSAYQRAPYGAWERQRRRERETSAGEGAVVRVDGRAQPPSYYGRPAVKASQYRWLIASYLFVGGLAGAAQVLAAVADLFGRDRDRPVVRAGRYVALAGALLSPLFLIADLHTRHRWYNMLRIFRRTSPMSIGSWTLAVFGTFSGLAAMAQALEDFFAWRLPGRVLGRLFGLPAAAAGVVMSYYTGILLSATSTPLWAAAYWLLPALFATSAMSTATSALSLIAMVGGVPRSVRRRLERVALAASAAELALMLAADWQWRRRGQYRPLEQEPYASAYRFGVLGLGILVPLVGHGVQVLGRWESAATSALAAVAALAGGYIQRVVLLFAGNESARRPEAYLRLTQPAAGLRGDDWTLRQEGQASLREIAAEDVR